MNKRKKSKNATFRLPRLGNLIAGGFLVAIIGAIVVLLVGGAKGGGGAMGDEFTTDISETSSEDGGEPFTGGPRLYFPVESIDMGQVPLNKNVSYAFAMTNVGDGAAHIEDVDVSILEGC